MKWTATRSEDYQATTHGRDMIQDVEIAAARDGRVLGLKVDLTSDLGAYLQLLTPAVPLLGRYVYPGIYKFGAHEFSCQGVFTTKTPTDSYRGAGRPEATFAVERIMDELAAELGLDPLELRQRNWISHDEFPYTTVTGLTYDSGNYEAATARAAELFGYDALRREQAERRQRDDPVQLGIGVSVYTEMGGLAPSRWLGQHGYTVGGWETASVRLLPTGRVEVIAGTSPHGQGHETTFSQITADTVGVPLDDIDVMHGDTDVAPWGLDTYGSRSIVVGGEAVLRAARQVVDKARVVAAHLLEVSPGDLEFGGGRFSVRGDPDASRTIQDVAFAAFAAHDLPPGADPVLLAEATVDPDGVLLPARHAPVRGRGRHGDRAGEGAVLRGRGRRRHGDQPDDRRRTGARRGDPGAGPGAVRGGRLRRRGRPGHRLDGRLPGAVRSRRAAVRHRSHRDAGHHQPARRQGRG